MNAGGGLRLPAPFHRWFMEFHPLDHDFSGKPGGSLPASQRGKDDLHAALEAAGIEFDRRWGRARLEALLEGNDAIQTEAKAKTETALRVIAADTVHDGEGGFLEVGALIDAVEPESLIAKGFAE
jgi:hypothetical protein